MGGELSGLPHQQRVVLGCGGTLENCLLKRGNNGNVDSSRTASGPIGQEDICGATLGAWNERWNLPPRNKGSSLGSKEITDRVNGEGPGSEAKRVLVN